MVARGFFQASRSLCLLAFLNGPPGTAAAANYPNATCPDSVTIKQIQDVLAACHPATGDTIGETRTNIPGRAPPYNNRFGAGLGGIVIGTDPIATGFDVYIQNTPGGPFSGIDVFFHGVNPTAAPYNIAIGDSIVVEWMRVGEFQNATQVLAPNNNFTAPNGIVRKVSSGNTLPPFFEGTTAQLNELPTNAFAEQYEGCLVRINGPLTVVRTSLTGGLGTNSFLVVNPDAPSDSVLIDGFKLTNNAPPAVDTPLLSVQGIMNQATRGYRIMLRGTSDIAADTTGFRVLTSVVGRGAVVRSRTKDQYPAGSPLRLTATPMPGARFVAWSGDTISSQSTLDITVERDLDYLATFERDPAASATVTSVADVPHDQGSFVNVFWNHSPIDDPSYPGAVGSYEIERRNPSSDQWSSVATVTAINAATYQLSVSTPADSTGSDPAVFHYRVLAQANSDTAQWVSNEVGGYSVDNLAPPAPSSVSGTIASGFATMFWPAVPAPDLSHYAIYRDLEPPPPTDLLYRVGKTTATGFSDSPGYFTNYCVTAVDVHGNESPGTQFVPSNPVDVPGRSVPKVLWVGNPTPSPMTRRMTLTLGLPRAMNATVEVLDSQGRLVRRLCHGEQPAGWVDLSWDARDASGHEARPGMYFVRVRATEGSSVRRLLLVP